MLQNVWDPQVDACQLPPLPSCSISVVCDDADLRNPPLSWLPCGYFLTVFLLLIPWLLLLNFRCWFLPFFLTSRCWQASRFRWGAPSLLLFPYKWAHWALNTRQRLLSPNSLSAVQASPLSSRPWYLQLVAHWASQMEQIQNRASFCPLPWPKCTHYSSLSLRHFTNNTTVYLLLKPTFQESSLLPPSPHILHAVHHQILCILACKISLQSNSIPIATTPVIIGSCLHYCKSLQISLHHSNCFPNHSPHSSHSNSLKERSHHTIFLLKRIRWLPPTHRITSRFLTMECKEHYTISLSLTFFLIKVKPRRPWVFWSPVSPPAFKFSFFPALLRHKWQIKL